VNTYSCVPLPEKCLTRKHRTKSCHSIQRKFIRRKCKWRKSTSGSKSGSKQNRDREFPMPEILEDSAPDENGGRRHLPGLMLSCTKHHRSGRDTPVIMGHENIGYIAKQAGSSPGAKASRKGTGVRGALRHVRQMRVVPSWDSTVTVKTLTGDSTPTLSAMATPRPKSTPFVGRIWPIHIPSVERRFAPCSEGRYTGIGGTCNSHGERRRVVSVRRWRRL